MKPRHAEDNLSSRGNGRPEAGIRPQAPDSARHPFANGFRSVLAIAVLLGLAATPASVARGAEGLTLYVASGGNDDWSGRLFAPNDARSDGPFATLQRARDAIRQLKQAGPLPPGGVTVEVAGGVYELARPLEFVQQDSGTEAAPIVYRARREAEVRLVGGKVVTGWQPVTNPAVLARLDEAARSHVLQADLKAQGVTDYGEMKPGPRWGQSEPGMELFFQDQPMTLARWPNEGFVQIVDLLGPTPVDVRGAKGCREGIFTYDGDRPQRWTGVPDIMLHGYWARDWADQRLKVELIDTQKRIIRLQAQPQHAFGFRPGHWYYAYNLLAELDQPGEWYLDRQAGILYFWPPAPIAAGKPMISVLPNLVTMQGVSFVTLRGMTLETCRSTAATISGGTQTRVVGCVIRNTGGLAVTLSGRESGVIGCDFYNLADGGVSMSGGDRRTLTPAGLYVDNCHLYRFGRWNPICKPGVNVDGAGNRVTHNLFHDAPHMAIMWGGNDHLFEFNEFHSVVHGANDAGIMYAGYNPAMRGHMIRYNYFHHVYGREGRGCNGVYLDDMFCSHHLRQRLLSGAARGVHRRRPRQRSREQHLRGLPAGRARRRADDGLGRGLGAHHEAASGGRAVQGGTLAQPLPAAADLLGRQLRRAPRQRGRPQHLLGRKVGRSRSESQARCPVHGQPDRPGPALRGCGAPELPVARGLAGLETWLPADSAREDRSLRQRRPSQLAGPARGSPEARARHATQREVGPQSGPAAATREMSPCQPRNVTQRRRDRRGSDSCLVFLCELRVSA